MYITLPGPLVEKGPSVAGVRDAISHTHRSGIHQPLEVCS